MDFQGIPSYQPITHLNVTRYTFDAWMRCYPESSREEYESMQAPEDYIGFLGANFGRSLKDMPNVTISQTLIDDDYFIWLDGRENTPETRADYASVNGIPAEEMEKKLDAAGLNISTQYLALPVFGLIAGDDVKARLRPETVNAIRKYITKEVNDGNFEVYVSQYLIPARTCARRYDDIIDMANAWFFDRNTVTRIDLEKISGRPTGPMMMAVPVIMREKHPANFITGREVIEDVYCESLPAPHEHGFPGRFMECLMLDGTDGMGLRDIYRSNAGRLLMDEISGKFPGTTGKRAIYPRLLFVEELQDLYTELAKLPGPDLYA